MGGAPEILGGVATDFPDYLRDESRLAGCADSISFPRNEAVLREQLASALKLGRPITLQGGRTGITGGAVPLGGHILNLTRMNRILGLRKAPDGSGYRVAVEPAVVLADLRRALRSKELDATGWSEESRVALERFQADAPHFFPPDPTEATCTLGGMVACNASGARTFAFGPTRDYVEGLRVVLADGSLAVMTRLAPRAQGRRFSLRTEAGRHLEGSLPLYSIPAVKNAAGYFVQDDMPLLDLFVGSEGTLGVISQIELRVVPAPGAVWGLMAFFGSETAAVRFVRAARCGEGRPTALEFFDAGALELLQSRRQELSALREVPAVAPGWRAAVYAEVSGPDAAAAENGMAGLAAVLEGTGGSMDATWLASSEAEIERLQTFRHAVPEAVNLMIDERRKREPRLTKLGTDLSVPDAALEDVLALYRGGLQRERLEAVVFGHIGDNHLHVNIIPRTLEEYERGRNLYQEWARAVVRLGGSVSAEHGIGKLKKALLREMYGEEGIRQMRALKRVFDPQGVLNPGNLFDPC